MEINEISMFMDVKIDINDRKSEAGRLRNWTKCFVKLEAIKSFPCFLRVTFIRNIEDESQNLCVPVHVPGVQIRLTNSRSKSYSYGLTWKHNRKRCHVFFAFESEISFERHMKWLKESLKNLELHRREILEASRKSRDSFSLLNLKKAQNLSAKTTLNDYADKKKLQDILGPLPQIPDKRESINWSRRISAVSGIYEEILDSENIRRQSQTSGIYEEMKPPREPEILFKTDFPPELPLRSRINTFENEFFETMPRCSTNPESIVAATKTKEFLQELQSTVSGRRATRCESVSEGKVSTPEELIDIMNTPGSDKFSLFNKPIAQDHIYLNVVETNMVLTKTVKQEFLIENQQKNRNSFSSPDLSKMNPMQLLYANDDVLSNASSTFNMHEESQSTENIHYVNNNSEKELTKEVSKYDAPFIFNNFSENDPSRSIFNVSDRINETFNFSINSSTVNLVGANFNLEYTDISETSNTLIDDVSGYCAMVPIKTKLLNPQKNDCDEEHFNEIKSFNHCRKLSDSDKENCDNTIKVVNTVEDISTNFICKSSNQNEIKKSNLMQSLDSENETHYQTPRKLPISIDDKVPSFYPNSCDTKKCPRTRHRSPSTSKGSNKNLCQLESSSINNENTYISSPQKILKQNVHSKLSQDEKYADNIKGLKEITPIKACKISENVYSVKKYEGRTLTRTLTNKNIGYNENDPIIFNSSLTKTTESDESVKSNPVSFGTLLQNIDFKFDDSKNIDLDTKQTIHFQKYSSSKYSEISSSTTSSNKYRTLNFNRSPKHKNNNTNDEKKSTLTPELGAMKKITSLQRLKKIDFSPLKLKINNVLQRNNSEGY